MKHTLSMLFVVAAGFVSPAMAWEKTTDFRGLEIYDYATSGISIKIVCDPDGAFIPPIYSARFETGQGDVEGSVALRTAEAAYTFDVSSGSVLMDDPESWSTLIHGLRSSSRFELATGDNVYRLDTGTPFPTACGAAE